MAGSARGRWRSGRRPGGGPPGGWRRVLADLPALLLVTVALHQIHLARTAHGNPWKGGGFGMFATTDHASARRVRAFAAGAPAGEARLPIPPELTRDALRVRHLPRKAAELARELAHRVAEGRLPAPPGTRAVRVEVWRLEVDLDAGALRERKLHQEVAGLPGPGAKRAP